MKAKPAEQADLIGRELVDELFNIKVLDPAMGSGHFLVEAVDYITDKTLEFLNAFPWNPGPGPLGADAPHHRRADGRTERRHR